jgi:hypothetical protein
MAYIEPDMPAPQARMSEYRRSVLFVGRSFVRGTGGAG